MKAFTLLELMITIGIVSVLAFIGFINLTGYRDYRNLRIAGQEIVTVLRDAQGRSMSQEEGTRWGVHFVNSSGQEGFYDLFRGTAYNPANIAGRSTLPFKVQFESPASNSSSTVIFLPITGLPQASITIKISLTTDSSASSTIIIEPNGNIRY